MSKLQAKTTKQKIEYVVNNQLPTFAGRYFKDSIKELSESSLYGYALDLASFFQYLNNSHGVDIKQMSIKDLDKISSYDIENYLIASRTYTVKGVIKERNPQAIHRRYYALQSFYKYFLKNDFIENYPIFKVTPPKVIKKSRSIPSVNDNMSLITYISSGNLPSHRASAYQKHTRKRDTLLIVLMTCVGIKASECVNLNIGDIYLEESYIYIKNRTYPKVNISSSIAELFSEYLSERLALTVEYGHEDALFISIRKQRICVRAIEKLLKKYITSLFGENSQLTSKDLNFSYKNTVFNNTNSILKTAELTGWSPETIYKIYEADLIERLAVGLDIFH